VSLNGTIQAPTDSFTVSGSTLTFASNLSTGDVIDFVMCFGNSLSAGTPTDATVSTAKIVDSAVTTAKINANAVTSAKLNNDIISGATELASEPADTDEFLVSDAGTIKRIDYSLIKGGGYTQSSVLTPTGATIEFTGLPSGINNIIIKTYQLQWAGSPGNIQMQLGDSGGFETSGYESIDFYRGVVAGDMGGNTSQSSFILAYGYSGTDVWSGVLHLHHVGSNRWVETYTVTDNVEYIRFGGGVKTLSAELTQLKLFNAGGTNADGGYIQIMYQ
jgi:hypothetical protein